MDTRMMTDEELRTYRWHLSEWCDAIVCDINRLESPESPESDRPNAAEIVDGLCKVLDIVDARMAAAWADPR